MKHRPFEWVGRVAAVVALAGAMGTAPARAEAPEAVVPPVPVPAAAASAAVDCPPAPAPPDAAQAAELRRHARDRGFLWTLRKDGRTSYLYGTVHVGRLAWVMPGPNVAAALRATDEIALEINPLDTETSGRLQAAMKPGAADAPLPEALAARLAALARAACLPDAMAAKVAPEMLAMSLAVVAGRRDGLEPAFGVDLVLASFGRAVNHPVRSLETPELQMGVIKGGGAEARQEGISRALDELESGRMRTQLLHIADIWADSRFDELERYAEWCDCQNTEAERALMRRALDDRNPGLADGIAALHDGGHTVFAAVGSLHMIGATGLPALLRARGFEVERIPFAPPAAPRAAPEPKG